jgi:hypothetical protein
MVTAYLLAARLENGENGRMDFNAVASDEGTIQAPVAQLDRASDF